MIMTDEFKPIIRDPHKSANMLEQPVAPVPVPQPPSDPIEQVLSPREVSEGLAKADPLTRHPRVSSGIPSVVFGLLGMQVLVPAVAKVFGKASGACLLSAIVVLSIMILPSIVSVSVTALNAVPPEYEQGSLALGATDTETWFKISIPAAKSGIATGIVLAIGRAIGETAVVLYTMGQAINLPISPFDSGRPMTVHLYLLANDGINMNAAYGTALLLMAIILAFNLFARYLSRKRR